MEADGKKWFKANKFIKCAPNHLNQGFSSACMRQHTHVCPAYVRGFTNII